MNTDIRLAVNFWDHPKTVKLERRAGLSAVKSLQILWLWAAINRPSGKLSGMTDEDIEIVSRWQGENGVFVDALKELNWLEYNGDGLIIHDWSEHNPWACMAEERSNRARFVRLARINKKEYERLKKAGVTSITKKEYVNLTNGQRHVNSTLTARQQDDNDPFT